MGFQKKVFKNTFVENIELRYSCEKNAKKFKDAKKFFTLLSFSLNCLEIVEGFKFFYKFCYLNISLILWNMKFDLPFDMAKGIY